MTFRQMVRALPRHVARLNAHRNGASTDFNSYMTTPVHVQRLQEELADIAFAFCTQHFATAKEMRLPAVRTIIDEFFQVYPHKPVAHNTGGSGFHNCFWLFITARVLNPTLLIESGVWKGQSSWILRQACPKAAMHCFDLSFRRLVYKDAAIQYHESDWSSHSFQAVDPKNGLCFFDDHVNQAKRVREAYDKGFRTLMFDDNSPAHKLYGYGLPGVPTIDMLFDERIQPDELIKWVYKGRDCSYLCKKEDEFSAKRLITKYVVFPDISGVVRLGGHSFLSLVKLVD